MHRKLITQFNEQNGGSSRVAVTEANDSA